MDSNLDLHMGQEGLGTKFSVLFPVVDACKNNYKEPHEVICQEGVNRAALDDTPSTLTADVCLCLKLI